MKIIKVTTGQSETLMKHLIHARELRRNAAGDEKIAWIRKCALLLHMIDPNVSAVKHGVVNRFFSNLQDAISRTKEPDRSPMDHDRDIDVEFESAVAGLEGLMDCILLAPESIHVDESSQQNRKNPYFYNIPEKFDESLVFVLMPFTESWSTRIWEGHIKPIVQGLELDPELKCKRADDLYGHDVLHDIVTAIKAARVIIADITSRNPNVFYELGIAHWMGKRVILLTQSVDDIPFDLLRFRHIVYEDNSDGYKKLSVQLQAALMESLS